MKDDKVGKKLRMLAEEGLKNLFRLADDENDSKDEFKRLFLPIIQYGKHILKSNNIGEEEILKEVDLRYEKLMKCDNFIKILLPRDSDKILEVIMTDIIITYKRRFSLDETQVNAILFFIGLLLHPFFEDDSKMKNMEYFYKEYFSP